MRSFQTCKNSSYRLNFLAQMLHYDLGSSNYIKFIKKHAPTLYDSLIFLSILKDL